MSKCTPVAATIPAAPRENLMRNVKAGSQLPAALATWVRELADDAEELRAVAENEAVRCLPLGLRRQHLDAVLSRLTAVYFHAHEAHRLLRSLPEDGTPAGGRLGGSVYEEVAT